MTDTESIYNERVTYSKMRTVELRTRIAKQPAIAYPGLTIFCAGSYGREEASKHSDIDMFFVCDADHDDVEEPRTRQLRLFGQLIQVIDDMDFPKFSNDCQYLKIIHTKDILSHLGSPTDDFENYFTLRMLLLLESKSLYGDESYNAVVKRIISSYYKDYPDHAKTFQPIFLMNDICRFWKTLLLNYENKRPAMPSDGQVGDSHSSTSERRNAQELTKEEIEEQKIKQKVRNFKLKFSRMTTCFATIASIGSYVVPVDDEKVLEQISLTPRERLLDTAKRIPDAETAVSEVLERYAWFLEKTGLPKEDLHDHFRDRNQRMEMFSVANQYGDYMYNLLKVIDKANEGKSNLLRYVVI